MRHPAQWKAAELQDVATVVLGQSPPGSSYNDMGKGLPFFQGKAEFGDLHPTPRKWTTDPKRIAEPNDILLSVRAPVGPTNLSSEVCCIGRGLAAIRPNSQIDLGFLRWWLRLSEPELAREATGTTFKAINKKQLMSFPVPVPPIDEQRRIVAAIEERVTRLDAGCDELRRAKENVGRIRSSIRRDAVCGRLVPSSGTARSLLAKIHDERRGWWEDAIGRRGPRATGHPKYAVPAEPVSGLGPLPGSWVWTTLDAVTYFIVDYRGKTPPSAKDGIPMISAANVKDGRISRDPARYVSQETYTAWTTRGLPEPGDLVITTEAPVAETALYPSEGTHLPTRRVMALKTNGVDNRYLRLALQGSEARAHIAASTRGTTVPRILKPQLLATPIALPPLSEQRRIADHVERLMASSELVEDLIDSNLRRGWTLRTAILATAFSGGLIDNQTTLSVSQ